MSLMRTLNWVCYVFLFFSSFHFVATGFIWRIKIFTWAKRPSSNGSSRYRVFLDGSWAWWRQGGRPGRVRWRRKRCRSPCRTTRRVRIRVLARIGPRRRRSPPSRSRRPSLHTTIPTHKRTTETPWYPDSVPEMWPRERCEVLWWICLCVCPSVCPLA